MTSCRYWPSPSPAARRPWIAVWLKTHWISRPTVTTWSNGQTGRSNQRWTPVIGEARSALDAASDGDASREAVGEEPATRSNGTARTTKSAGDRLARAARSTPETLPSSSQSTERTPGRQADSHAVVAEPAFEPRAVKLAERDERESPSDSHRGCAGSRRRRPCGRGRHPSVRAAR